MGTTDWESTPGARYTGWPRLTATAGSQPIAKGDPVRSRRELQRAVEGGAQVVAHDRVEGEPVTRLGEGIDAESRSRLLEAPEPIAGAEGGCLGKTGAEQRLRLPS